MLSFECDYNKGAHKKILERLLETNEEPAKGYGFDPYCASAAEKILILSILVYTLFSRMFDLMQPPAVKHSIAVV